MDDFKKKIQKVVHSLTIELKPYPKVQKIKKLKHFYPVNPCSELSEAASATLTIIHLPDEGGAPRQEETKRQAGGVSHFSAREAPFCRVALESCGLDPDLFPKGNLFSTLNKVGLREEGR